MLKRIVLSWLIAGTCLAGINYIPSPADGEFVAWTGGYYLWQAKSVTPTSDLILEYLWLTTNATDTSGQGNDGVVSGTTWNTMTNGIGAYRAMGATGTVTVTVSGTKTGYSFFARTNNLWRFYEVKNGTEYVDLALEDFDPTDFYSVSGDVITVGGADHDINNFEAYSISNNSAQSVSNFHRYAVDTGVGSKASRDNDLNGSLVFGTTLNGNAAYAQDESTNNASLTVTAVTALDMGVTNAAGVGNGSTSILTSPYQAAYADLVDGMSVSFWGNRETAVAADSYFMGQWVSTGNKRQWSLRLESDDNHIEYQITTNGEFGTVQTWDTGKAFLGVWQHYVLTTDNAGTVKFYADGEPYSTNTGMATFINNMADFTAFAIPAGLYTDVDLDEIKLYSEVLSPATITNLFLAEHPLFGQLPNYADIPQVDSLVALYTFNAANSGKSQDYSGNGNHGTDTAMTKDVGTGVVTLNGSTSYSSLGDDDKFSFGNASTDSPFSISGWINRDATGSWDALCGKGSGLNDREYVCTIRSGDYFTLILFDSNSDNRISRFSTATVGTGWYHIAATYDGSGSSTGIVLYIDGQITASTADDAGSYVAMHNYATSLRIGDFQSFTSEFDGQLDNVMIFDTALTSNEVNTLYNDFPYGGQ